MKNCMIYHAQNALYHVTKIDIQAKSITHTKIYLRNIPNN